MFGKWNLLVLWFSVVVEGEVERRNGQKIKKGDKPRIWDRRKFGDVAVQTIWLKKTKVDPSTENQWTNTSGKSEN